MSEVAPLATEHPAEGADMGITFIGIDVANPATPEETERVEFLVDSGAVYSVVPTPVLERLGIRPLAQQQFRLADGSKVVRKKGVAVFRHGELVGGADVIFGEEGDSNLLGALTLEALGLSLDPLRRELKPLPMILALSLPENQR
jgi:clan AA aspartic protease